MNRRSFLTNLALGAAVLPGILKGAERLYPIEQPIPAPPNGYILNPAWESANYEVSYMTTNPELAKHFSHCDYRGITFGMSDYPLRFNDPNVYINPLIKT